MRSKQVVHLLLLYVAFTGFFWALNAHVERLERIARGEEVGGGND